MLLLLLLLMMLTTPLLAPAGVPPPRTGEGEGAEPGLSADSDHLSEGHSGKAEDRTRCNSVTGQRDQQLVN